MSVMKKNIMLLMMVVILPLLLIITIFLENIILQMESKEKIENQALTDSIGYQLNLQFKNIILSAGHIWETYSLTDYRLSNNTFRSMESIDLLSNMRESSPMVSNIYLYLPKSPVSLSSNGSISHDTVAANVLGVGSTPEDLSLKLSEIEYITEDLAMFSLNTKLFLVSKYNEDDYSIFEISKVYLENFLNLRKLDNFKGMKINCGNESYVFLEQIESDNDVIYTAYLPNVSSTLEIALDSSKLLQEIMTQRVFVLTVGIGVIAFVGTLVFILSKRSYRPIGDIRKMVESFSSTKVDKKNELFIIEDSINQMHSYIAELSSFKEDNSEVLKHHFFYKLILGKYSIEDINNDKKLSSLFLELGITLEYNYFCVIMIKFDESEKNWDKYDELWHQLSLDDIKVYSGGIIGLDTMIALVCSQTNDTQYLCNSLTEAKNTVFSQSHANLSIYVGKYYKNINHIPISYNQAIMAHRFHLLRDEAIAVVCYTNNDMVDNKYKNMLYFMKNSIIRENGDDIKTVIEFIRNILKNDLITLNDTRFICSELLETINQSFEECGYANCSKYDKTTAKSIKSINNIQTSEDFTAFIDLMASILAEYVDYLNSQIISKDATNPQNKVHEFNHYLMNNIPNNQFSISNMAEHFGYSKSYICRVYKEKAGVTILEALNNFRIEKAKELLLKDKAPLEEIVLQIGYSDTSSFIRKFKNGIGVTPGEYRKLEKTK